MPLHPWCVSASCQVFLEKAPDVAPSWPRKMVETTACIHQMCILLRQVPWPHFQSTSLKCLTLLGYKNTSSTSAFHYGTCHVSVYFRKVLALATVRDMGKEESKCMWWTMQNIRQSWYFEFLTRLEFDWSAREKLTSWWGDFPNVKLFSTKSALSIKKAECKWPVLFLFVFGWGLWGHCDEHSIYLYWKNRCYQSSWSKPLLNSIERYSCGPSIIHLLNISNVYEVIFNCPPEAWETSDLNRLSNVLSRKASCQIGVHSFRPSSG